MAEKVIVNGYKAIVSAQAKSVIADALDLGGGITPTGSITITTTEAVDVTNYASAQVVDANLIPENIKSGETILGVTGTYSPTQQ